MNIQGQNILRFYDNLKLGQKLSLVLLLIFIAGSILSGIALSHVLTKNTEREITSQALILMDTMNSVRDYTSNQIKPELDDRLEKEFLPQTVPAYSATEVFQNLRQKENYQQFFYKEATLNPTNPRDQADDFETEIIEKFRSSAVGKSVEGFRKVDNQEVFYIARPLQISKSSCLECHSTPDVAPVSMIKRYGKQGGFNWKLNEVVGSQIVSVPASTVIESAHHAFILTMSIVLGIFASVILLINFWLRKTVVRPVVRMTKTAEMISQGDLEIEFFKSSNDEIGELADSFSRMKTSFILAMKKLNEIRRKNKD
jgi:methyl-accepting chemotaxis protein